ncbi:9127_t:CDS:2, partial [Acaulospora morrowiae]
LGTQNPSAYLHQVKEVPILIIVKQGRVLMSKERPERSCITKIHHVLVMLEKLSSLSSSKKKETTE